VDGVEYALMEQVTNPIPEDMPGSFTVSFAVNIQAKLRFLKVEARSLKTCPDWHIGAGKKCWIFTDEIVVQ
jgi:hypothetical protein